MRAQPNDEDIHRLRAKNYYRKYPQFPTWRIEATPTRENKIGFVQASRRVSCLNKAYFVFSCGRCRDRTCDLSDVNGTLYH